MNGREYENMPGERMSCPLHYFTHRDKICNKATNGSGVIAEYLKAMEVENAKMKRIV